MNKKGKPMKLCYFKDSLAYFYKDDIKDVRNSFLSI